jgi:hypothetical protein
MNKKEYVSKILTPNKTKIILVKLIQRLFELFENEVINIQYGWACEIHNDLQYVNMRTGLSWVNKFIMNSIKQGIYQPGESDLILERKNKSLSILFCHEGDVHISGNENQIKLLLSKANLSNLFDIINKKPSKVTEKHLQKSSSTTERKTKG